MKKVLLFMLLFSMAITSSFAQEKDVTKFLGIPVDGTKAEMIAKLKEKGFTSTAYDKEVLEGEFNGKDVNIHIVTNGNKVYRIMVADQKTLNETDIRIRFNILIQQFSDNGKYTALENAIIPDDEDISYEMSVKNKRYEASFIQYGKSEMENYILSNYSQEDIVNLTAEDFTEISLNLFKKHLHKQVWFTICDHGGQYYISIFYDNTLNTANGEDL